jgi:hypothetical protein
MKPIVVNNDELASVLSAMCRPAGTFGTPHTGAV